MLCSSNISLLLFFISFLHTQTCTSKNCARCLHDFQRSDFVLHKKVCSCEYLSLDELVRSVLAQLRAV